jgi:hypothetical protein
LDWRINLDRKGKKGGEEEIRDCPYKTSKFVGAFFWPEFREIIF